MHVWKRLAVAVAALAAASGAAFADNYSVSPADDVQSWIDQSQEGDIFYFTPGTYNQAIVIPHSLQLRGQGNKASIILDASGLGQPAISINGGVSSVRIKGMTLRFGGDHSIHADNDTTAISIEQCVFRGTADAAVSTRVGDFSATSNNFRGCDSDIDNESYTSNYRGNRHFQTLRQSVFNSGQGSLSRGRFDGIDGTCVVFAESGFFFGGLPEVGSGSVTEIFSSEVKRSNNGLFLLGTGSIYSNSVRGATGQGIGVAGYDSTVTKNKVLRFGVGINVYGEQNTVSENTLRDGTVGVFLVGGANDAVDNQIQRATVGIRMGERYGNPFFLQEGGGPGARVRNGIADSHVLGNDLSDILGIGIAVDSMNSVEISGNTLKDVGGRSLDALLMPAFAQSGQSLIAGAITVYSSDSVTVASNEIGDVDAGAGVAVHRASYSSVASNVIWNVTGNGIGFSYGDPFFADGEYHEYYEEYEYGSEGGPENMGRGLYARMNIFGPLFNNAPDYPAYAGYFFYIYFINEYQGPPAHGVGVGGYYYDGYQNSATSNTVTNAALRYGAGISAYEQSYTTISGNAVVGSGSTGILIDDSDYCLVNSNSVLSSEADGIWITGSNENGGNVVEWNTVSASGAEGIQNDATNGYNYNYVSYDDCNGYGYYNHPEYGYMSYCNSYNNSNYEYDTIIRNNTVVGSGIAPFANSGDVDVNASTGNSPQPADWYDIPVRQY